MLTCMSNCLNSFERQGFLSPMRLLSLRHGVIPQNPFPSSSSTLSIIYLLPIVLGSGLGLSCTIPIPEMFQGHAYYLPVAHK